MNEITLEKLDVVIDRTGCTYKEAKEALENFNGDVVDAIISIEQKQMEFENRIGKTKNDVVSYVKKIIKKGNVSRIKIKKEGKILVDIPVNVGLITTGIAYYVFPLMIPAGIAVAAISSLTFEITKTDGSVEVVNEFIKNKYDGVKDKAIEYKNVAKDKFGGVPGNVKEKVNDFISNDVKDKFNNLVSEDVKDKISNMADKAKSKINQVKDDVTKKSEKVLNKDNEKEIKSYTSYTVKFDDEQEKNDESDNEE